MQAPAIATPGVLIVLVAHDGAAWLPRTLAALRDQTYPAIDVLAVDNASQDGSRELLFDHLGEDRVLVADRDVGFGAAVAMALDARAAADKPYVLLLHDDCALAPDAVAVLVDALEGDPRLAVVGPKLRSWYARGELQSVGWTVDLTGRADSGVDPGELDQGQRDQERRSLYVSTSGMLVRRDVFEDLGGFDRRYHVFRDDLDLCWRAWLRGHEVEVVPDAVGEHVAGATNYLRLGQARFIGPRYFAERNTLATLLKNYGAARLLLVAPLYFLVGIAKVVGFLLTRRVSDAWQTVRAWLWNVLHARETWRLRRVVQRSRTRSDRDVKELFGRVAPRVRAYVEAMADWVAGGDVTSHGAPPDADRRTEPETATRRMIRFVGRHPILVVGTVLFLVVLAAAWPLLLPGELRGGELGPWPQAPAAFLSDYVAGWHEAAVFGTGEAPSPAQALLGLLHLAVGGSSYLAPRLLLLGTLAVGWVLSLRVAQTYSSKRLPRVVAATAYVLSPPALAALANGRIGALVVLAVLPGILAGGVSLARRATAPDRAWRGVAGVTLLTAIGGAFEPLLLLAVVIAGAGVAGVALLTTTDPGWRRGILARTGMAAVGPLVLLLPWSLDLIGADGLLSGAGDVPVGGELWRWLLLAPDLPGMPGLVAGFGFLLAGLLGLVLAVAHRPRLVASLWAMALVGAVGGWWLDRTAAASWAGLPLLLTAAAFAGLFALAFATAEAQLTRHAFGWRQLASLATAVGVTVSLLTVGGALVREPWDTYAVAEPPLPSFVMSAAVDDGPFRVLVLGDQDGRVSWDVVEGTGPTMAAYGVPESVPAVEFVGAAVDDLLTHRDPGAADQLGLANVRYVVVPAGGVTADLDSALLGQVGLEPQPVSAGRVLSVSGWMPRAAALSDAVAEEIAATGARPEDADITEIAGAGDARYRGVLESEGSVIVAEIADDGWQAVVDGREVVPARQPFVHFRELPAGRIEISHAGTTPRSLAVTGQLLALLFAISLALRPPGFARRGPAVVAQPVGKQPVAAGQKVAP